MFLDIDMDERSGMDIARRVRELHLDTIIIFVTNYPEFSMEGYEVRAFRYLLKQELQQSYFIFVMLWLKFPTIKRTAILRKR